MTYSATFKEAFATKFGHSVLVENQKGEWKLFGRGEVPSFRAGDEVEFEAEKKPNKHGQSFWHYSNMQKKGSGSTPQGKGLQGEGKDRLMFVTGVVGRAMGSGKFDSTDIESLAVAADQAFKWLLSGDVNDLRKPGEPEDVPYDN